jgi:putative tricarboxylic transport membrane protein
MNPSALRNTDFVGGLATLGLAAAVLIEASQYGFGTILRMGPGYFPTLLGGLLLVLGLLLALRGLRGAHAHHGEPIAMPAWRPILFISAALGLFAYLLPAFGLAPAIVTLVVVSACAAPMQRPITIALLAVGLTVFSYVVFVRLLSLHIDLVRW